MRSEPRARRRAFGRARNDGAVLALRAHADRQDGEQHRPPDHDVDGDGERDAHAASGLLQLDQRAVEILGMQEQHRLAVRADLGLAVAEHARARGLELVARAR